VRKDVVSASVVARFAASLDIAAEPILPDLWHWLFCHDTPQAHELGPDGHRATGGDIAHDADLPARSWAGGTVHLRAPIPVGCEIRRESSIVDIRQRQGSTGRLQFVTTRHSIFAGGAEAIEEQQDIVYRAIQTSLPQPASAPPAPENAVFRTVIPDEILLFRFSALTFNSHRIHYDHPYATQVEHYPGLVVHGPLQAILLAGHLRAASPGVRLRRFTYRARSPAFSGEALRLEAWPDPTQPGTWHLQTRAPSGAICMAAQAETVDA
jgi:3-methylfumaryl-CoA hydratase